MAGYPTLFSPGRIGSLTAKNRLVMAPMVRNYANEDGSATPRYRAHIERIAEGGVGTMVLEAQYVQHDGRGFANQLGIHHDGVIQPLRELVEVAHAHGALIGPQLYHAGRQTSFAATGTTPVAPSPIPDPLMQETPRQLTIEDIEEIVASFGEASRRARDAGCDFVEIHGAHGYLITQFLSPFSNQRTDRYGGDPDARMRFLLEVIDAVADRSGLPTTVRLSGDEMVPGGLTPDDVVRIAQTVERTGVVALNITAGNYASYTRGYMMAPMARPDGLLVDLAEEIKRAVSIPVMTVGKIRTPELAESIVADGRADFVALGRQLLADQAWPRKAEAGEAEHIRHCIACNQGCVDRLFAGKDVWCTVNPTCGFEEEFPTSPAQTSGSVLVVGGGPAGMQAAINAAQRGYQVTLCERGSQLGGQLIVASATPQRPGWEELRRYLIQELDVSKVEVRLDTPVTPELVDEVAPDAVIVATGSEQVRPDLPGIDDRRVITSRELLEGHAAALSPVVVAGGGCAGAQTAEHLAVHGHDVTLIEQLPQIAGDAPMDDRAMLLARLRELGVDMRTETKLMRVEPHTVQVEDVSGVEELRSETVVLCLGATPSDGLVTMLEERGLPVHVVGDAKGPRKVTEAIHEGALAGQHA